MSRKDGISQGAMDGGAINEPVVLHGRTVMSMDGRPCLHYGAKSQKGGAINVPKDGEDGVMRTQKTSCHLDQRERSCTADV